MAAIPTWLWTAAGWTLIALGLILLIRGRLFRAPNTKPHCQHCGYSAEGLTTLTCPECGRTRREERPRPFVPRRKTWRAIGILLVVVGWAALRTPPMLQHGWPAAIPDWALALFGPKSDGRFVSSVVSQRLYASNPSWYGSTPSTPSLTFRQSLENEIARRFVDDTFSSPFAEMYLRRCVELTSANARDALGLPFEWPWNVDLDRFMYKSAGGRFPSLSYATERPDGPARSMRFRAACTVAGRSYALGTYTVDIDATRPVDSFLTLKNDEASTQAVRAQLHIAIGVSPKGKVWLENSAEPTGTPPAAPLPAIAGLHVRIMLGAEALGSTNISLSANSGWGSSKGPKFFASTWWFDGGHDRALAHLDELELEITGDTDLAWDEFRCWPRIATTAWTGSTRIKPVTVRRAD